ncbi:J domain-containing protein [Paenibacillus ginsengihumi]|uniref:J domain-containing protein n=1 Tax=Paenibacillus ginsengihumi TaxID=431596 RepID=UPI00037575DB|nr:J domain-containing protein [Paenibacillus ginsengihumi]
MIWKILGIDPTEDQSQIRKAYARMLKKYHPEDDPEGYQRLREAFDEAMRLAKQGLVFFDDDDDDYDEDKELEENEDETVDDEEEIWSLESDQSDESDEAVGEVWNFQYSHSEAPPLRKSPKDKAEEFLEELDSLYSNLTARCDISQWQNLLNNDVIWDLGHQGILLYRVFDYLNEHYFLPGNVWELLDSTFGIKERYTQDPDGFSEKYPKVCEYTLRTSPVVDLGYSGLTEVEGSNIEDYLYCREEFLVAMLAGEMEEARKMLLEALRIYDRDVELLHLQTKFYFQTGEWEQALSACNYWISQSEDDDEAQTLRASILLNMGRLHEAQEALERLRSARPDDALVLSLLGKCYLQLDRMEAAHEVYDQLRRVNPQDIEAVVGLAKIDASRRKLPRFSKGRRKQIRQLKQEWGRLSPGGSIKRFFGFFLLDAKFTFLLVLLHIALVVIWQSYMDISLWNLIKQRITPPEITWVTSKEDLKNVPVGSVVHLKLTNAAYTGLLELELKDDDGNENISYMLQNEAEERGVMDKLTGYVSTGKVGDISVVALTDYDDIMHIYENYEIELEGIVQDLSSPAVQTLLGYRKGTKWGADFSVDLYVNARDGLYGRYDDFPWVIRKIFIKFLVLLLVLYVRLLWKLYRSRYYLMYK